MLPPKLLELTNQFIEVYDSEHSFIVEFRKAHTSALARLPKGFDDGPSNVILIGNNLTVYLDHRIVFIWEKYKHIIQSIGVIFYPELSQDLKIQIALHFNKARLQAETYLEGVRKTCNAPTGYTAQTKNAFENVLKRINVEIDQFCVAYPREKATTTDSPIDTLSSTLNEIKAIQSGKKSLSDSQDNAKTPPENISIKSETGPKQKIHWIPDVILAKYPKAEEFIIHVACLVAGGLDCSIPI